MDLPTRRDAFDRSGHTHVKAIEVRALKLGAIVQAQSDLQYVWQVSLMLSPIFLSPWQVDSAVGCSDHIAKDQKQSISPGYCETADAGCGVSRSHDTREERIKRRRQLRIGQLGETLETAKKFDIDLRCVPACLELSLMQACGKRRRKPLFDPYNVAIRL